VGQVTRSLQAQGASIGSNMPRLFRASSQAFAMLAPEQRARLEVQRDRGREAKLAALRNDRLHVEAQIELHRSRSAATAVAAPPCRLSSARFTEAELQRWELLDASGQLCSAAVHLLRAQVYQAPQPPPLELQEALECADVGLRKQRAITPWLRMLAAHRHVFSRCVFVHGLFGEAATWYLLMFATQSPLTAHFMRVHTASRNVCPGDHADDASTEELWFLHRFHYKLGGGCFVGDVDVP
jgi:hypothetical protein